MCTIAKAMETSDFCLVSQLPRPKAKAIKAGALHQSWGPTLGPSPTVSEVHTLHASRAMGLWLHQLHRAIGQKFGTVLESYPKMPWELELEDYEDHFIQKNTTCCAPSHKDHTRVSTPQSPCVRQTHQQGLRHMVGCFEISDLWKAGKFDSKIRNQLATVHV